MVMKKNVMGKNLTQSILRSIGRYLAIVLIIALGSALFVGLLMTREDMVQTGQVFADEQNMFDLRFVSSLGWTDEQIEKLEALDELTEIEASNFQDAIVRLGEGTEDVVFRFYSIPEKINRVALRGGRMPERPDECLADGYHFDDSILGTKVTLAPDNEELAFDSLAYDTYTVVGYVATPIYMDQSRGTTTVGNGSIKSYLYIPAEGFSTDYFTEVNATVSGDHTFYSGAYDGLLDDMTNRLEPQVQQIADAWFQDILDEAEAEYADGYQEYLDGVAELEQGKLDAQKELDDAYQKLLDAEKEIADSEALLDEGEAQIEDSKIELKKSETDLKAGVLQLAEEKSETYATLDDSQAELDANAAQVAESLTQVNEGLESLEDGLEQTENGIAQLESGISQLDDGITQLEEQLPQLTDGISQIETALPLLESGITQLDSFVDYLSQLTQPVRTVLDGLLVLPDSGEETIPGLQTGADTLHELAVQIQTNLEAMSSSGAVDEDASADIMTMLTGFYTLEAQIRQTMELVADDPTQMESLCAGIETTRTQMDTTIGTYTAQRDELTSQKTQYTEQMTELQALETQYTTQRDELKSQRDQYSAQLAELNTTRDDLISQRQELLETKQTLEDAQETINESYKTLEEGRAEADAEFAKAEQTLKDSEEAINEGWATIASKEKEIEEGRRELEEGKVELADGWIEYEEGKLEAEQEIADAEAELADAAQKLADARQEIDDLEAPETYVLDRNTNVGYASLESNADIVAGVSRVFPVFFLLIAALVCITTMSRMVGEERTQIGTLKAMGYSGGAIMSKYLIYAGTGGILGCGLGVLAGCTLFPQVIWDAYQSMLYIAPDIQIRFNWKLGATVTLAYTAVVLAVTWYCCYSTLKEAPAELIRPKAPTSGKKILLEYLPFWNRLSFLNKVALRNIFRYRQRLLMMLIGIGGCTALLVTGFGIRDSIRNIVPHQYEQISRYDLEVYFDEDQTGVTFEDDGVKDILFYHQASMEVDFGHKVREITLLGADEAIGNFIDMRRSGDVVAQPGPGETVMTIGICETLGIAVGDTVVLRNPDMQELHLTVSGIYENYVQNFAIVSPETIADQWGEAPELQNALVKVKRGADIHEVGTRIANMDDVATVMLSEDNADHVSQMMEALDAVMWLIVLCAGMLAVIVLYNLININVSERIREIATIKVLGFHSGETASYVFKENMVLSVVGAIAGLGLGKMLLDFVLRQVKIDAIWFQSKINISSLLISVALTLLATLVVQFIFTFKIERINMAEALKSVE